MPLSYDQPGKLQGFIAILKDRSWNVCLAIRKMDEHPLSDDDLSRLADECLEIQDAALALELLFRRAVCWGQGENTDEADDTTTPAVQPEGGPSDASSSTTP